MHEMSNEKRGVRRHVAGGGLRRQAAHVPSISKGETDLPAVERRAVRLEYGRRSRPVGSRERRGIDLSFQF